ncbi:uncharacterized protein LOC130674825 isoform X1 [Microplitis mediator]|uniref:uncharacterized protein LOC130674825 isoform X1 n=1 Tax=Microplitis mediator TaxID=375433 RepID=UPI002552D598|nr:uncharacterized protein LOC130674825 isoform X1 [Microplitis mediator]
MKINCSSLSVEIHESIVRHYYEKSPKSRLAVIFTGVFYVAMTTGFIFGIGVALIATVFYLYKNTHDVCKNVLSEELIFDNIFKWFYSEGSAFDSVNPLVFITLTFNLITSFVMIDVNKKKFRPGLAYLFAGLLGVSLVCEGYNIKKWFEPNIPFDLFFMIMILAIFFISAQLILSNTIFMHYINLSAEQNKYSVDPANGLIVDKIPEATKLASYSEMSNTCNLQAQDNELI